MLAFLDDPPWSTGLPRRPLDIGKDTMFTLSDTAAGSFLDEKGIYFESHAGRCFLPKTLAPRARLQPEGAKQGE
jgi:hypothetical protein